MSHLTRPRAHFYGKIAVNMPSGNNAARDSRGRLYFDAAHAELDLLGGTPAQFRSWFHQLNPAGYVNGGWNYYGDNGIRFEDVTITSVELPNQPTLTRSDQDSCIGTLVKFMGNPYRGGRTPPILVDLDPNDGFTTQLFGHHLTIEHEQIPLLSATAQIKTCSSGFNFWRNLEIGGDNGAAALWYFTFPDITFQTTDQSPFLGLIQAAAQQGQGICVRLCTYLFQHRSYRDIAQQYKDGNRSPLPGAMMVLGTIGLWHPDEPITSPAARVLLPDLANPLPIPSQIRSLRRGQSFYGGAALADVDTTRKVITLDLVNTFPEIEDFETLELGNHTTPTPEKIDLGVLSLQVDSIPDESCQCIGVMVFDDTPNQPAYHRAAYLLTGGIVEIPYPPEMEQTILTGDLVLLQGSNPDSPVILRENPYHVLIEPRAVYLELEDEEAVEIPLRVLLRGQPAPPGLLLNVEQTVNFNSQPREAASDTDTEVQESNPAAAHVVAFLPTALTDENGKASLNIQALRAGMGKLWINTPTDPDWQGIPPHLQAILRSSLGYFVNFRVLPDDRSFDAIPEEEINWDLVYSAVLRYYSLLYPIMNFYINFDDEEMTRQGAQRIVEYIQPSLKDTTIYMPITRDLSAGKRRLLERWAKLWQINP